MTLPGTVETVPVSSLGFDTDTCISSDAAKRFVDKGYTFCIRYLSLGTGRDRGDLSVAEANDILNAGLALMVVQHAPRAGWEPSQQLGQTYGSNAASNANALGFPPCVNIW